MKNIVFIGMPGSGKSTFGKKLSDINNKKFIDIDDYIEKKEKNKITTIFEKYGEDYFRKKENSYIKEISKIKNCIIATGGGVVKNEENIKHLKKNGIIIFLDRNIEEIYKLDHSNRPLLKNKDNILKLYNERINLYKKYSDYIIKNDKTINEILEKIQKIINEK